MAVLWEVRDRTEEAIGMAVKPWVDPEIAELLSTYPPDQFAGPSKKPLAELRDAQGLQKPELSERVERTEHTITDPYTTNEIVVRVHRPVDTDGKVAAIFDIHGGGYVRGSYDGEDKLMDDWCPKLGCIGVAVEYRRAPETRYPGALEDSYVALKWLHDHAADLGIATERVGIRRKCWGRASCGPLPSESRPS
jgi:acetyl esterase/lipase